MTSTPLPRAKLMSVALALASALLTTACAPGIEAGTPDQSSPSSVTNEDLGAETDAPFTHQDRLEGSSEELKALLTELSLELDGSGPELTAVGIGAYGAIITIDVHIASAAGNQNVAPESLQAILESIAKRSYPSEEVQSFELNVWGDDGFAADASEVGEQIGVKEAYLDREWQRITFPSSAVGSLFG